MASAFDAFQHFEGAVGAEIDLVDALELVGDAEALADKLEGDAGAAAGRLPSTEEKKFAAVEAGDGGDSVGENGGGGVRVNKA